MIKFLSGNTELTDCTDINPFYPESMPDFQSKKRTPEKIENDPKATPPASSKMPKEDNPPFFVYLTRPQKLDYHNDRIELNIRKALYDSFFFSDAWVIACSPLAPCNQKFSQVASGFATN